MFAVTVVAIGVICACIWGAVSYARLEEAKMARGDLALAWAAGTIGAVLFAMLLASHLSQS